MRFIASAVLALLATLAGQSYGADGSDLPSPAALAETMRLARYSAGFEARMRISSVGPDGKQSAPFKVAVVGQIDSQRERLAISGISPPSIHDHSYAAERTADGRIRVIEYGARLPADLVEIEPTTRVFDSALVVWDMLAPWWHWPKQISGGVDHVDGRDCQNIRSVTNAGTPPIPEVVSCVDAKTRLPWRTQLFDRQHILLRTISTRRTMRMESGAVAVRRLTIADADRTVTDVDVYSGDEHYAISAATFAALDYAHPAAGQAAP
jgi:hypothetical protein